MDTNKEQLIKDTPPNGVLISPILAPGAQAATPSPSSESPTPPPLQDGQTPSHELAGSLIKPIRTYADDIKEAVEKNHVSVAKIIVEETKKREEEKEIKEASPRNPKNIAIVLISIIFILAGGAAYGYFYLESKKPEPKVVVPEYRTNIIKTDGYKELGVAGLFKTEVVNKINAEKKEVQAQKTLKEVVFTTGDIQDKKILSVESFFELIDTRTPEILFRAFEPVFMFGFHAQNTNDTFMILKNNSYESAYAGMLEWESSIANELGFLFFDQKKAVTKNVVENTTGTTTATTTQPESPFLLTIFTDVVEKNKDLRVLKDINGDIIFVYGFADTDTIIMTSNITTFIEISDRLKSTKLIR